MWLKCLAQCHLGTVLIIHSHSQKCFFSVLFFTVCFCHSCLSFITTLSAVSDINSSLTFKLTGGKNIITPGFSKIWVKKCQRRQKKLLWKFKFPVVHLSSWMDRHSWTGGDEDAARGTIIRYVTQRRYIREKKGGEEKRSGGEIREWESRTDCCRQKTTTWVNCGIRLLQPTFTSLVRSQPLLAVQHLWRKRSKLGEVV